MKRRMMRSRQISSDVLFEILALLPVNTLLRFKSVCKEWYTVINNPLFIQLHFQKSIESNLRRNRGLLLTRGGSLDIIDDVYQPSKITTLEWPKGILKEYESTYSVGVCNGLACFRVKGYSMCDFGEADFFIICNPSMRTFKITPPPIEKEWPGPCSSSLNCFGYDSEHDDYKIVIVSSDMVEDGSVRDMLIYSLKADLWKCVTPTPPSLLVSSGNIYDPVFVNNMIHYRLYTAESERIARFDLSLERWMDDLLLPVQILDSKFGVMDGCIYQCASSNYLTSNNEGSTDVWIMEKQGGKESESSWSNKFHLPGDYYRYTLIASSKKGSSRFILLQSCGVYGPSGDKYDNLNWYDQQGNISVSFKPKIKVRRDKSVELYIGSVVSIPGCSSTKMQQI